MLLANDFRVSVGVSIGEKKPPSQSPPPPAIPRGPIKLGLGPRAVAVSVGSFNVAGSEEELRMCAAAAAGDMVVRGFSHESEHDLAALVSDFLENGSSGAESWYSSDSESGFSDLHHLAERILVSSL